MTIGVVKDPTPNLSIKEATELVLPNYIESNKYEDKQLEESVECTKMIIQGYDTCSFIYSEPKSYFDTYPRIYFMMVNAKIGDELWITTFTASGDKFEKFEQNAIQMVNSMKVVTTTTEQTTKDLVTSNTYKCNPIDESITLQNKIDPKGVVLLGDYGNCKLYDGIVTINLPNKNDDDLQFTVMNIDINTPTNSQGAIIEMEQIKEDDKNSSEDNQIFKINLKKEMNGKNPITGKPIKISQINGLAVTIQEKILFLLTHKIMLN